MRIYHVTLTREMHCTIAAENEAELQKALADASYDFDDWNPPDWEWSVFDPLSTIERVADLERLPTEQKRPHMGVDDRGEIVAFSDLDEAETMAKIEETVRAVKLRVGMAEVQGKIPGVE